MPALASLLNIVGPDLLVLSPILGLLAFNIWMAVDCVKREPEGSSTVAWFIVILFAPLGSLIYLLVRKLPRPSLPHPASQHSDTPLLP